MRLPRKAIVCGEQYKITRRSEGGGSFYTYPVPTIEIGKEQTEADVVNALLHETIEATMTERMLRFAKPYSRTENGNFLFVMDHPQFEELVKDLRVALNPLFKKEYQV